MRMAVAVRSFPRYINVFSCFQEHGTYRSLCSLLTGLVLQGLPVISARSCRSTSGRW
jgi:hypothetical protein